MPTEIKSCKCSGSPAAVFQDKTYGDKMRVFNQMKDPSRYRCTVCGSEKSSTSK